MGLVEKVCEELGIEVGETWLGNDGYEYKIIEGGLLGFYSMTSDGWVFDTDLALWSYLITGELKPVWKPKEGEEYYIPYIHSNKEKRYTVYTWDNDCKVARFHFENNLVFKTKEEAIEATNKILEALREE